MSGWRTVLPGLFALVGRVISCGHRCRAPRRLFRSKLCRFFFFSFSHSKVCSVCTEQCARQWLSSRVGLRNIEDIGAGMLFYAMTFSFLELTQRPACIRLESEEEGKRVHGDVGAPIYDPDRNDSLGAQWLVAFVFTTKCLYSLFERVRMPNARVRHLNATWCTRGRRPSCRL